MVSLVRIVVVFLASSVAATNFPPKYGHPRAPYRRHPGIPRGLPVGLLGPISHRPPVGPPIHPWIKKLDPRSGRWVKVVHRKPQPMGIISPEHFARKAHIARKMHSMVKARSVARMNSMRAGMLGAARQRYLQANLARNLALRDQRRQHKAYPGKGMPFNLRPDMPRGFGPRLPQRPMIAPRINSLLKSDSVNGQFYEQIDDTFDDRFDSGFVSIGRGPISRPTNQRIPFVQNNVQQIAQRRFTRPVHQVQHRQEHYPKPLVTPTPVHMNTGNIGGSQTIGLPYPDERLKHGVNEAMFGSFDRKSTSFESNHAGHVDVPRARPPFADNTRFFNPSHMTFAPLPNPQVFPEMTVGVASLDGDDLDGFDDVRDHDGHEDRFEDFHHRDNDHIEDQLDDVNGHLELFNDRLDLDNHFSAFDDMKDTVSEHSTDGFQLMSHDDHQAIMSGVSGELHDEHRGMVEEIHDDHHPLVSGITGGKHGGHQAMLGHVSEELRDDHGSKIEELHDDHHPMVSQLSGITNHHTMVGGLTGEVRDDLSDFNPLRGIGGEQFGDTDDRKGISDDGPIMGLQLLGPSSWQDVLTELQTVGGGLHDDTMHTPGDGFHVLPVNPHSREEILPGFAKHDNGMMMGSLSDIDSVGTLALLGIDPSTIHALESVVGNNGAAAAPDHPPPIPLPKGELSAHKQDPLDAQTTSKTAITDTNTNGAGLTPFEQTMHDTVDALNQIATLDALKELDIVS